MGEGPWVLYTENVLRSSGFSSGTPETLLLGRCIWANCLSLRQAECLSPRQPFYRWLSKTAAVARAHRREEVAYSSPPFKDGASYAKNCERPVYLRLGYAWVYNTGIAGWHTIASPQPSQEEANPWWRCRSRVFGSISPQISGSLS